MAIYLCSALIVPAKACRCVAHKTPWNYLDITLNAAAEFHKLCAQSFVPGDSTSPAVVRNQP
ncbi:protein of unknown function [Pseudomonas sp. JV241A]|nr:protein of unknown function [Pseudomonas sp. JV241A]